MHSVEKGLQMNSGILPLVCLAVLAGLMAIAAIGDWRRYKIPNELCALVAIGGLGFWLAQFAAGQLTLSDLGLTLAIQLGLALVVFMVFAGLFAIGAMGGGDVKLMAALTLWIPPAQLPQTLVLIAIGGGIVSVVALFRARRKRFTAQTAAQRKDFSKVKVPYGVAIALGGLVVALEPILKVSVG
jgi:prepilin peptidase CpaA